MIGQDGRYFEIIRAVLPDLVTVTMADAFRSIAVVQVACAIAFVISGLTRLSLLLNRFTRSMSASVRSAIRTIVLSASTGYSPAAVSPDSMIAEVPS